MFFATLSEHSTTLAGIDFLDSLSSSLVRDMRGSADVHENRCLNRLTPHQPTPSHGDGLSELTLTLALCTVLELLAWLGLPCGKMGAAEQDANRTSAAP